MDDRFAGGQLRHFVQPCLLLLLKEEPDYGYDLVARLRPFGVTDSAAVYRALRGLEADGAVTSTWRHSAAGPARRMYHLTGEGEATLEEWAATLAGTKRTVEGYLVRYAVAQRATHGTIAKG
ncbi:MAG: PadR family transcriptional regulator, regulatory protein PadR [Actinomycetota bacterium]|nr:PadR family transcriptional regulator, regulatory protein PadR [Actinomycetota bacterium]